MTQQATSEVPKKGNRALSLFAHYISHTRFFLFWPISQILIWYFIKKFKVSLADAIFDHQIQYRCFNDFFTRKLHPHTRPIDQSQNGVNAPSDGIVLAFGDITNNTIFQAKGFTYTMSALLGEEHQYSYFYTIYLSPSHYHRAHAPLDGFFHTAHYRPGETRSVSRKHVATVPNLYTENERLIQHFSTPSLGSYAIVMVGAQNVASISTPWYGECKTAFPKNTPHTLPTKLSRKKGEEIANFNMGSTIVFLLEKKPHTNLVAINDDIKVNQKIAVM